jgi:hypothetical protein
LTLDKTFDLSDIIDNIKIEFLPTTHSSIKNYHLVARRNVLGLPFRPAMKKADFEQINNLFVAFIKELPVYP